MVNGSSALNPQKEEAPPYEREERTLKHCTVTLSEVIARGKRLEASVFDVDAIQAYSILTHGKYPAVSLIGDDGPVRRAYHGARQKRHYVDPKEAGAVGFLGSSEMLDLRPMPQKFMIDGPKTQDLRVKKGMVLISRSGTIGNVAYVGDTLSRFLVSEHAIRLECGPYPGYVYAFLKSETGKTVISSTKYGAVIQEIEPQHLATVPIPDAPVFWKEKIHDLVVRSYALRDESNVLLDQAQDLLVKELRLPKLAELLPRPKQKRADVDAFSVRLSALSGRMDASYHTPAADAIVRFLKQSAEEVTTVGDPRISREVLLPERFKRVYVDEGYGVKFLGGKEFHQLNPVTEKYLSRKAHREQIEKVLGIKPYSILTPARGSLGEVELPCSHFLGWAISDNMMQIVSYPDLCGYVYVFLNTEYGRALIRRFTYGGVVDAIEPEHIRQVEIPLLKKKDLQQDINNLALEANRRREEAYLLERQALELMEEKVIFAK